MIELSHEIITGDLMRPVFEGLAAAFIGPAFAMLFSVPSRCLIWTAIGAGVTRYVRAFLVYNVNMEIVIATFLACSITSLIFIYVAPRLNVPRPVFTVASIIPLIPGMDAYNALLSLIAVVDGSDVDFVSVHLVELFHKGTRALAIMLSIALGLAIPPLFFYRYRYHHL